MLSDDYLLRGRFLLPGGGDGAPTKKEKNNLNPPNNKKEVKMKLKIFEYLICYGLVGEYSAVNTLISLIKEKEILKVVDEKVSERICSVSYTLCELDVGGKYDRTSKLIMINKNLSEEERKKVLRHEVGHMIINEMFVDEVDREMYNAFLDARDVGEVNFVMVYAYRYALRVLTMNDPRVSGIKDVIRRFM